MTQWGSETAKEYDESPDKFVPREPDALEAILSGELGRIGDALGSGLGQGLASLAVPVATALPGAALGAPLGPVGMAVGARAGAGLGSFALNYGDTYDYLLEQEKVEADLAAKVAVGPGVIMAALDMIGLSALSAPFRNKTQKEISRSITKRFLQLGKRGFTTEGATELAQQIVQELTGEGTELAGVAGTDIELNQRMRNVINAGIIGSLTGGTVGTITAPLARPTDESAAPVLPDVTEGLPETLDIETETTLEEDTADGEQSVTEADMASEGQLDLNFASEEVAQDEVESAVTPPASDEFVTEQVEGGVDETVAPDLGPIDIAGVSDEVVDEQLRQVVADPSPEGPAAPDLGELDLEVTEPVSPEFQDSSLETIPVAAGQMELFPSSTIEELTASAQSATPKLSTPEHIVKKVLRT